MIPFVVWEFSADVDADHVRNLKSLLHMLTTDYFCKEIPEQEFAAAAYMIVGVWCGVVWCGVVWCGVVWCGVVWCGVVWCGVVWCASTHGCSPMQLPFTISTMHSTLRSICSQYMHSSNTIISSMQLQGLCDSDH